MRPTRLATTGTAWPCFAAACRREDNAAAPEQPWRGDHCPLARPVGPGSFGWWSASDRCIWRPVGRCQPATRLLDTRAAPFLSTASGRRYGKHPNVGSIAAAQRMQFTRLSFGLRQQDAQGDMSAAECPFSLTPPPMQDASTPSQRHHFPSPICLPTAV